MYTATIVSHIDRVTMRDDSYGRATLRFELSDKSTVALTYMPAELAERLVEAWHEYDDRLSGRETAPAGEYAAAIADLPRQQEEARKMK